MNELTKVSQPEPPIDQDALSVRQLAKGVLARDFRPRTAAIRRLAEAVLAAKAEAKPSKKKNKKGKSGKSGSKKRKLAKIPGQKSSK